MDDMMESQVEPARGGEDDMVDGELSNGCGEEAEDLDDEQLGEEDDDDENNEAIGTEYSVDDDDENPGTKYYEDDDDIFWGDYYDREQEPMDLSQALVLAGTGQKTSAVTLPFVDLKYDIGFGDLCLDRVFDLLNGPSIWAGLYKKPKLTPSSFDTSLICNQFQRSGKFPFFKLPLELREKIYRLLLAPFIRFDKNLKPSFVYVGIESPSPEHKFDDWYAGDYENYCKQKDRRQVWSLNRTSRAESSPSDSDSEPDAELQDTETAKSQVNTISKRERTFLKNKKSYWHSKLSHPYRTGSYEWFSAPTPSIMKAEGWTTQAWLVKFVQDLSYISRQFRYELNLAFWKNAELGIDYAKSDPFSIIEFLEDRPAVRPRIKSLDLGINLMDLSN